MTARPFAFDGFHGEAAADFAADPAAEARRLLDPAAALRTLHWGRNYLYVARLTGAPGAPEVVVKQFRGDSARERRRLARGAGKARRSWEMARALAAAGFVTPEPLLLVEPDRPGGVSLFVCRHLAGRIELRYPLRARNAGRDAAEYPQLDFAALIEAVAGLARRLHDAGFWHRDYSVGNLLLEPRGTRPGFGAIALVDLNRCRRPGRVSTLARLRDLCRLPLDLPEDRQRLLAAYFGGSPPPLATAAYELMRRSFHGRHRLKPRLRAWRDAVKSWLIPRGTHAHIPPPPEGAGARDKIVWDHLSDQPHSHAGRLERAGVRLADLPVHLRTWGTFLAAVPRIRRRYRELRAAPPPAPFAWPGAGVALRPFERDPAALLAAFDDLGLRQALIRLHPWQERHDAEAELARELAGRGVELTFALPQNRELVRDPARWRAAVEELAERFLPFGRRFQIGQAINRSKWGVWNYGEYLALAAAAAEILRARGAVELAGPAVIDFEAHVTAAVVNLRHPTLRFDALASLLYVDRRGAPENRQLGFDTVDKVTLLAAVAETARRIGSGRHWITEVNWPLAEGPHSPAGRKVAVGEREQADFLVRFYLQTLGSGRVERVFWWQLVARGYGLIDPGDTGVLRRRPAFAALATLERQLAGSRCLGARALPAPARAMAFARPDGGETLVAWTTGGELRWTPGGRLTGLVDRGGHALQPSPDGAVTLGPSPLYLRFAAP
ncbi:MAG: lipopolysaccharide kinase InaA family protein [Thermoanaerobaculia bacterium]|nr:lipopolysaccharide kinase InaA family protein [Thermoanaerobaculia bacterium]